MVYYDTINASDVIDINKTSASVTNGKFYAKNLHFNHLFVRVVMIF